VARPVRLVLKIDADKFTEELTSHIKEILFQHPGEIPVHLMVRDGGEEATAIKLGDLYSVEIESDLVAKLKSLLGESAVRIEYPDS
jgi:hypothetical protein